MIVKRPDGREVEVVSTCDFSPYCRDCRRYMKDCDGDVDHDPSLAEDCDIKDTPWGEQSE